MLMLSALSLLTAGCSASETGDDDDTGVSVESPEPPISPSHVEVQIDGYTATVPAGPKRLPHIPENLTDYVRRGVSAMSKGRLERSKCVPQKKGRIGWRKCIGNYLAAAVGPAGEFEEIDIYGGASLSHPGFSVTCERDGACNGGVNPPLIISSPPGWTVVAIRTAVFDKKGPEGIGGAVYVPYSSALNTPELRQEGLEYLRDAVMGAYYELRAKDVRSQFIHGSYVTDFGTPDHVVTLILTEQMWSAVWFTEGTDAVRLAMLDRTLTILALNRSRSYSYTVSSADARGMGQIVDRPYDAIRDQYPGAELPQDSIEGRTDHHTTVKAMICHADAEWWTFKSTPDHRDALLADDWSRRLVLAAGYNANIATVKNAIQSCGETWRDESCTQLPSETRMYLLKYEWIHGVLFDPDFRSQVEQNIIAEEALVTTQ